MNPLLHFLLNYFLVSEIMGVGEKYLLLILIFSVILDLDHIPYILKNLKVILKNKKLFHGFKLRTRFHELYGLTIFSLFLSGVYFFDKTIASIGALCILSHYVTDFLVGQSRPFYPYSNKVVLVYPFSKSVRVFIEVALTLILGVYFFAT